MLLFDDVLLFRKKHTEESSLLHPFVAKFYDIDSHQTCGFLDLESMNCKRAELRNLPFLHLIPFQDNVCYRKVQGINIISCFRKHDVLMKYERHIKQV